MNLLKGFGNQNLPVTIKDPFGKDKVTDITVYFTKSFIGDNWSARGSITFKNGQTEGKQQFKGNTFDDVVLQIKTVLNNL
jgi:hypothetical protein